MADRLQQLSFTDGLTGAMNRNAFIRDITRRFRIRAMAGELFFR